MDSCENDFSLLFFQHHGVVLASLEALRLQAVSANDVSLAWSVSVIQEMLSACKTDLEVIKVLHNIVSKRLAQGPYEHQGSLDASIAYSVFSNQLTEIEL